MVQEPQTTTGRSSDKKEMKNSNNHNSSIEWAHYRLKLL